MRLLHNIFDNLFYIFFKIALKKKSVLFLRYFTVLPIIFPEHVIPNMNTRGQIDTGQAKGVLLLKLKT